MAATPGVFVPPCPSRSADAPTLLRSGVVARGMTGRQFIAPARYVQGPGVLDAVGEEFGILKSDRAVLVGGETAVGTAAAPLRESLSAAGIEVVASRDDADACTHARIDEYAATVREADANVVVGVGGGVALDVAQAAAHETGAESVAVPTIASTDAPCSTISVVYDDDGRFLEAVRRDRNPELVVVDSRVVAAAPARFLRHGMGDALATRFEAEGCLAAGAEVHTGGRSSHAAVAIARECYDRIAEHGTDAVTAARRNAVTPALERVVEANVLLSGLGFESGGTAGAHAVQIGLTNGADVRRPHGELVAFGTVVELVLADRPDALAEVVSLCEDLELAVTLDGLGVGDDQLLAVGEEASTAGMEREPFEATPRAIADAVRTADGLLRG